VFLASNALLSPEFLKNDSVTLAGSIAGSKAITGSKDSLISVKVYYLMMAQYVNQSEEDFVLQTPATLQTLIDTCIVRHPSMAQMVTTMLILLNGVPSKPGVPLRDTDTIQLVPLYAGG
jgi:molybdopterin converting factor small subunit